MQQAVPVGTKDVPAARKGMSIGAMALMAASVKLQDFVPREFKAPDIFPGVVPRGRKGDDYVALDSQEMAPFYAYANGSNFCGLGFPGYAYLAQLAQITEYRNPFETISQEMTRRWIKFTTQGDGDKADKIRELTDAFEFYKVRDNFKKMAEQDGSFGRAQLFVKIKGQEDDKKRQLPLLTDPRTIPRDSLLGFKPIEAIWTTPSAYNSQDPTRDDFMRPQSWYVLGKKTHQSRLLTFISREVPDLLKPSYNFGGLAMSQLMEPYVNQWLRTRNSVSNLLHSFSISVLKTDLQATLAGDDAGEQLFKRAQLFNLTRDNRGLMMLDKDAEDMVQINTPLSGLADLQSQAQEHMSAPCHIPLVKLLGISPEGLNANSDGEITVFYDFVSAMQEALFKDHLITVLNITQLSVFGSIDEDISFEFEPLRDPTPKELSEIRKADTERATAYITSGVITPEEERARLAADPFSGYNNIAPDDVPDAPEEVQADISEEAAQADHQRGEESAIAAHKRSEEAAAAAHQREIKAAKKKGSK